MTIEPAQGGFTSTVRRFPSKSRDMFTEPEQPTIHPSIEHLQAHVGKMFGPGRKARAPQFAKTSSMQRVIAGNLLR